MAVATTKRKGNKSQQIRDYHKAHPSAKGSEIAKALGLSPALVYNVLSRGKKHGRKRRGAGGATMKRGRRGSRAGGSSNGYASLEATAVYVKRVGSIEAARKALDDLQKLQLI